MPLRRQSERDDIVLTQRRSSMLKRESKLKTDGGESDEVKVWKSLYFEAMLKLKNEQAKKQTPRDSQQFVDTNWLQGELAIAKSDKEQLELQLGQLKLELFQLKANMEDTMETQKMAEPPVRSRSGSETTHVNPMDDFYDELLQTEFSATLSPSEISTLASTYSLSMEDLQRKAIEKLETITISKAPVNRSYANFEDTCMDLLVNILQWKNHPDLKPQKMSLKLVQDNLQISYEDLEPEEYTLIGRSEAFQPYFKNLEDSCLNILVSVLHWKNLESRQPLVRSIIMEGDISIILSEKETELYQSLMAKIAIEKAKEEFLPTNFSELQEMAIDIIRQRKPSTEMYIKEECSLNSLIINVLVCILQWKDQTDSALKLRMAIDKTGKFQVNYFDFPDRALDIVKRNRLLRDTVNTPEEICLQVILQLLEWKPQDAEGSFVQSVIIDGSKCICLTEKEDAFYKMYLDRARRPSNQSQISDQSQIGFPNTNRISVDIPSLQSKALGLLATAEKSTRMLNKKGLSTEDLCLEVLVNLLQWKDQIQDGCLQIKISIEADTIMIEYARLSENSLQMLLNSVLLEKSFATIEDVCLESVLEVINWKNENPNSPLKKSILLDRNNGILLGERESLLFSYILENSFDSAKDVQLDLSDLQESAVDIIRQRNPTKDAVQISNCTLENICLNILVNVLQWKDKVVSGQLQITIAIEDQTMYVDYTDLSSSQSVDAVECIKDSVETLEEICLQLILEVINWKNTLVSFRKDVITDGTKGLILDEKASLLYQSIITEQLSSQSSTYYTQKNHKLSINFEEVQHRAIEQIRARERSKESLEKENLALEDVCLQVLVSILQWKNIDSQDPFQISIKVEGENTRILKDRPRKVTSEPVAVSEQVALLEKKLLAQKQKAKIERRALEDLLMKQFQKVRELEESDDEAM
ncbi:hypothetical protein HDV01_003004 [Terramyces sp. JEL0728]|nr:hypothetical protein HDV01_003004 [Terramyces sp. JEL0728]